MGNCWDSLGVRIEVYLQWICTYILIFSPCSKNRFIIQIISTVTHIKIVCVSSTTLLNHNHNHTSRWGEFCARFAIPVICVSVAACLPLLIGIHFVQVTTDPVQLWSSPTSDVRIQKNYFDQNFGYLLWRWLGLGLGCSGFPGGFPGFPFVPFARVAPGSPFGPGSVSGSRSGVGGGGPYPFVV